MWDPGGRGYKEIMLFYESLDSGLRRGANYNLGNFGGDFKIELVTGEREVENRVVFK